MNRLLLISAHVIAFTLSLATRAVAENVPDPFAMEKILDEASCPLEGGESVRVRVVRTIRLEAEGASGEPPGFMKTRRETLTLLADPLPTAVRPEPRPTILWAQAMPEFVAAGRQMRDAWIHCADRAKGEIVFVDALSSLRATIFSISVVRITSPGVDLTKLVTNTTEYSPTIADGEFLGRKGFVHASHSGCQRGYQVAFNSDAVAMLIQTDYPCGPLPLWFDLASRTWIYESTMILVDPDGNPRARCPEELRR